MNDDSSATDDKVTVVDNSDHQATIEEQEAERSRRDRIRDTLHTHPTLGPLTVLALAMAVFSAATDTFLTGPNLSLVVQQVMVVGTLAIGQTLIILTAGIDLSVGAVMVFSSIVMAKLAVDAGVPPVVAILAGIAVATACGLFNGLLVTRFRLPPFITTLGTLNIFFALNLAYSEGTTILGLPPALLWMGRSFEILGTRITYGSVFMLLVFAVGWYALQWTAWGKHVYATGDDIEAARLSGIRVDRVRLSVYITAGVVYGLAAWVLLGRIGSASPQTGLTANLDTITAVVIGGTSLFGGRGRILGTLLGALVVGVFRNGLSLLGMDSLWQDFSVGVLVLVAVGIDQWIRRG